MFRLAALVAFAPLAAGVTADLDPKALAGTWLLDAATLGGRDHLDDFDGMTLTVAGDKYTVGFGMVKDEGTLTLDPAKSPKWIDLKTSDKGPFKGRSLPGIYELKGDTLTICCDSEAKARPATFEAKEKTSIMLLTFKRAKK